jgi:hypothetical protein
MKYAILLECDPGNTLGGSCIRDVRNMAEHLVNRCMFDSHNIHVLTTNSPFQKAMSEKYSGYPAKEFFNVIKNVKNISNENDTIVFLISGHGYQTADRNGDETDGLDEMISIGFRNIIDDDIYVSIKDMKSKMILLSDTCHSGTMFDLPHVVNNLPNTKLGNMISISACADAQLSMCDIGEKTGFGGSLTTSVLEDSVLEMLVSGNTIDAFNLILARLRLLNQTAILSTN